MLCVARYTVHLSGNTGNTATSGDMGNVSNQAAQARSTPRAVHLRHPHTHVWGRRHYLEKGSASLCGGFRSVRALRRHGLRLRLLAGLELRFDAF
jgi:hypothetical protein